jgi:hypothetical protein
VAAVLRPEVVASISPGATVRVVDETAQTPRQGPSIADFVHSLSSKEHRITVTYEDRLGEKRERDFRLVAAGRHAATDALAVTFYPGSLKSGGVPRVPKNLADRRRPLDDAERNRVAESDPAARPQRQQPHNSGPAGKKPVRRNARYERIDIALRQISQAHPKNHEEVFRFLNDRNVARPARKVFRDGWLKGFQMNRPVASAWLSHAWARLDLPSFPRGPKK